MKYLFIGGTKFVGRQMVEDALNVGHEAQYVAESLSSLQRV